jgi:hypothetical protein
MNKKYNLLSLIKLLIIIILTFQVSVFCQKSDDLLNRKIDLEVSNTTMLFVLNTLASDYQVPIGFERAPGYYQQLSEKYKNGTPLNSNDEKITIKKGTLKDILDSLIAQESQYSWEVNDGVINIYPARSRDSFVKELLDTKITKFSSSKETSKFNLGNSIFALPEIKSLLKASNVELFKAYYSIPNDMDSNINLRLNLSNTTVRGIFNKIVKESVNKIWLIERVGDKKESLSVSF